VAEVTWNTDELKVFARSLNHDKDGRALKLRMQNQFDSITENLRDRLYNGISTLPGVGRYPSDLAESVQFKTKIIGGKNARVSIVGEGKTSRGKWREIGHLLDDGYLYHPAWGHWRGQPAYLREEVAAGPEMVTNVLDRSEPNIREEILTVLTDYLDKLTDIRKGLA
jgi:hypothetical protein